MSGRRQWGEDSTVCLKLSAGASLTLTFKGNLFDLTGDERELIGKLTKVIQEHTAGEPQFLEKEAAHG